MREQLQHVAGMSLITRKPQLFTNAVYVSIDEMGYHKVVSDFGNPRYLSTEQLINDYELSKQYLKCLDLDIPVDNLTERWEAQIELSRRNLEAIKEQGDEI